jgi:hypothetical protein
VGQLGFKLARHLSQRSRTGVNWEFSTPKSQPERKSRQVSLRILKSRRFGGFSGETHCRGQAVSQERIANGDPACCFSPAK